MLRRAPLVALALTTSLALPALAACGTPPWDTGSTDTAPAASVTPAPSVTPTPTPTAAPTPTVANDLRRGSVKRTLTAGGLEVAVTYYSDLPMDEWTPQATKPLHVVLGAKFVDGSTQDIFLRRVQAQVEVTGPDGPLEAVEPLNDKAGVSPGYLVTDPSTYDQVFTLPAVESTADVLTLSLTYELLAQSAPTSKNYLKQTASDTVRITLTPG